MDVAPRLGYTRAIPDRPPNGNPPVIRIRGLSDSRRLAGAGLLVALGLAATAAGHEPARARIETLTLRIEAAPDPAALLERAELRRICGDFEAAEHDCERALELAPGLHPALLSRARIALDRGDASVATARVREFLARGETADGLRILARSLAAAGRPAEAAAATRRVIAVAARPEPGDFFECARQEVASGRVDAALAILDEGCARLGPLRALRALAVGIARDSGRTDDALARIDTLLAEGGRTESWLVERGRLLARAGRAPESWVAFSEALAAIEALPESYRDTSAIRSLQAEIEEQLRSPSERSRP